jgi:hypothetical protein
MTIFVNSGLSKGQVDSKAQSAEHVPGKTGNFQQAAVVKVIRYSEVVVIRKYPIPCTLYPLPNANVLSDPNGINDFNEPPLIHLTRSFVSLNIMEHQLTRLPYQI